MRCDEERTDAYFFTTPRTLLSILRLAQALARLRFSGEVAQGDVDEAMRLMYESKRSIDATADPSHTTFDPTSSIFELAKALALVSPNNTVKVADIETRAVMKGLTKAQLTACLEQYESLNVWQLEANASVVRFVDAP